MDHQETINDVQELALELEKFRQIVETASDAVVSINQNHEVVYMNAAAESMFGYRREEIMGGDLSPLIPHDLREAHRGFVERYLRTRQAKLVGHIAEVTGERRDHSRFPLSISFSVAETQGGTLLTAILRDRSAERDLQEQVKRSQDLAAVGQLVATVSHEIRTPLALIGGFARQILREKNLTKRARHKVDIIVEEVGRLEGMLNDLKDLSRAQHYEWDELDLAEVVARVAELMGPEMLKLGLTLRTAVPPDLPRMVGDRNRLCQVLINLLQNAMQASQAGSEVVVELGKNGSGGVVMRVKDQGGGIHPEDLQRIFEPFYTTKKRGTGLGLPVARRIVAEHGGRLGVESQPGRGTTMTVELPPPPKRAS